MTTRFALRAATEDIHRELDERLSVLNLAEMPDYRRFLQFHARTLPSIEGALALAGIGELVDGWSATRRTSFIETDFRTLGEAMPPAASAPPLEGPAQLLGTAYVVEGSRLGARVLSRRVAEGLPASFLNGDGSLGSWPSVIAALDRFLYSPPLLAEAEDAARRCFAWFLNVALEIGL
jgi:heme oxygenase